MIIRSILSGDFETAIIEAFVLMFIIVFINPVHEFAHAFTAYKLGDNTPRLQGRLTLNPLASLDLYGALLFVLVGIGWAKPVQINSVNFRCKQKTGIVLTAAAGPVSNLLFAFVISVAFAAVYRFADTQSGSVKYILTALYLVISINVMLALFNLIPLPPLDGSRILAGVLPDRIYFKVFKNERLMQYGLFGVLLVSVILSRIGINVFAPLDWLADTVADAFLKLTFLMFGMQY